MCLTPRDLHDVEGTTDKRATVRDRHAEVSRGHIRRFLNAEGPNIFR